MSHVWRVIDTFFGGRIPARITLPPRVPVVALVAHEEDRQAIVLMQADDSLDLQLAKTVEHADLLSRRHTAPIILLDRDWPEGEWRQTVERFSASPHSPCVILLSNVTSDNLWEQLIRCGGYEILKKPLRPDRVARMIKLALSYWTSATRQAVTARKQRNESRPRLFRKSILS